MSVEANPTIELNLTLAQQWVIHHALLEYVEIAADADLPEPTAEVRMLEKIEAGILAFTACELRRLRQVCERHADSEHTPTQDHEPARTVARKIGRLSPVVGRGHTH